jgi:hypothetical protein
MKKKLAFMYTAMNSLVLYNSRFFLIQTEQLPVTPEGICFVSYAGIQ